MGVTYRDGSYLFGADSERFVGYPHEMCFGVGCIWNLPIGFEREREFFDCRFTTLKCWNTIVSAFERLVIGETCSRFQTYDVSGFEFPACISRV